MKKLLIIFIILSSCTTPQSRSNEYYETIIGHIIQTVTTTSNTIATLTSTTMTSFGLSQSFTPKAANSIILIRASIAGEHYGTSADRGLRYEFTKDGSQIRYWPYMDYHSSDASQNISIQLLEHSEI